MQLILKKFHLAFGTFQVTRFARIRFLAVMFPDGGSLLRVWGELVTGELPADLEIGRTEVAGLINLSPRFSGWSWHSTITGVVNCHSAVMFYTYTAIRDLRLDKCVQTNSSTN